tara:strand:- start:3275 stop:4444 length:1170 start_codon:yes stop_codon:yes gene_type:complete
MKWSGQVILWLILSVGFGWTQTAEDQLHEAIDQLAEFDYSVRVEASRALRRADPDVVRPVLLHAVEHHQDSYVQFRSLVLIYGLDLPDVDKVFSGALNSSNDRVRASAYEYFETFPSPEVVSQLLAALDTETSEFVRPYLVRALAANDDDSSVRERLVQDIHRGQSYFRGAVIEALGDHRALYAVDFLIPLIAEDGPFRDDALLALGKIGDRRIIQPLRQLQRDSDVKMQPIVSAAACLLDVGCEGQLSYIVDTLRHGMEPSSENNQELIRNASTALSALATDGRQRALDALFELGVNASESVRAPIALALGKVALRNPQIVQNTLVDAASEATMPEAELLLLRDAFDMLDEDFAEERFYVLMRKGYWEGFGSAKARAVAAAAIRVLEF